MKKLLEVQLLWGKKDLKIDRPALTTYNEFLAHLCQEKFIGKKRKSVIFSFCRFCFVRINASYSCCKGLDISSFRIVLWL